MVFLSFFKPICEPLFYVSCHYFLRLVPSVTAVISCGDRSSETVATLLHMEHTRAPTHTFYRWCNFATVVLRTFHLLLHRVFVSFIFPPRLAHSTLLVVPFVFISCLRFHICSVHLRDRFLSE